MRDWGIDPRLLCDKHLGGNHVELHMLMGSMKKGRSIQGFLDKGRIDIRRIKESHDNIANEMKRRGMTHRTPIGRIPIRQFDRYLPNLGALDTEVNIKELRDRCAKCAAKSGV